MMCEKFDVRSHVTQEFNISVMQIWRMQYDAIADNSNSNNDDNNDNFNNSVNTDNENKNINNGVIHFFNS